MVDPLSVGAGVVGIVAAGLHSIRGLASFIADIKDAPKTVSSLRNELNDVESILEALGTSVTGPTAGPLERLAEDTKLKAAIKTLTKSCELFSQSLARWMKHSKGDHKSTWDNIRTALNKDKIALLSQQLNSCKQTLTMALASCTLQTQLEHQQMTEEIRANLSSQEQRTKELMAEMKAIVVDLREKENQLTLIRKETDDDDELESVRDEQEHVERTRRAVSQYQDVCEWIAKQSVATQTGQEIGNATIADTSYAAVGMSNIGQLLGVKQKIGDVNVGAKSTAFVGIHNNVDHNAARR